MIIVNNNNSVIIATKQVTGGNNFNKFKNNTIVLYREGWTKKNSCVLSSTIVRNNTGQPNNDNRASTVNHSNEGVGKLIKVFCSDGKG